MTLEQAMWARGHSWFILSVPNAKGEWKVTVRDNECFMRCRDFYDYQALREWAGY